MAHTTLSAGDLTAIVGDNAAGGGDAAAHRAGYNGVWSLRHSSCPRSLFVPAYAGLNFEHIFDGENDQPDDVWYEPRRSPMELTRLSDAEAELHQPPTPRFQLDSWTRFLVSAPHYLDMTFRYVPTQHTFRHGYIGLFWASYIDGPEDKSMYFLGGDESAGADAGGLWQQLCTPRHNDQSTVRHRDDQFELTYREGHRDTLYRHLSPLRFDVPVFYGLFEGLTWAVMFDRAEGVRLTHSPSGGGLNEQRKTTNPAWDFQFILPEYEVTKEYGFKARTLLRPRCSREALLEEYEAWRGRQ